MKCNVLNGETKSKFNIWSCDYHDYIILVIIYSIPHSLSSSSSLLVSSCRSSIWSQTKATWERKSSRNISWTWVWRGVSPCLPWTQVFTMVLLLWWWLWTQLWLPWWDDDHDDHDDRDDGCNSWSSWWISQTREQLHSQTMADLRVVGLLLHDGAMTMIWGLVYLPFD